MLIDPFDRLVTSSAMNLRPVAPDSGGGRRYAMSSFFAPGFGWLETVVVFAAMTSAATAAMATTAARDGRMDSSSTMGPVVRPGRHDTLRRACPDRSAG